MLRSTEVYPAFLRFVLPCFQNFNVRLVPGFFLGSNFAIFFPSNLLLDFLLWSRGFIAFGDFARVNAESPSIYLSRFGNSGNFLPVCRDDLKNVGVPSMVWRSHCWIFGHYTERSNRISDTEIANLRLRETSWIANRI